MVIKKSALSEWPVIRRKMIYRHPELTLADLLFEEGKEEELLIRLQRKTGRTKEQLIAEINTIFIEV